MYGGVWRLYVELKASMWLLNVDEAYNEWNLVCMTSSGRVLVFSLPHLRRQLSADATVVATADDAR